MIPKVHFHDAPSSSEIHPSTGLSDQELPTIRAGGRCSAGTTSGAVLDLHFDLCAEKIKQGDELTKGLGVVRGI
jgi:hypothetical protein